MKVADKNGVRWFAGKLVPATNGLKEEVKL